MNKILEKWEKFGLLYNLGIVEKVIIADAFEYVYNKFIFVGDFTRYMALPFTRRVLVQNKKIRFDVLWDFIKENITETNFEVFRKNNFNTDDDYDAEVHFIETLEKEFFENRK
jgi:hypothetical protein